MDVVAIEPKRSRLDLTGGTISSAVGSVSLDIPTGTYRTKLKQTSTGASMRDIVSEVRIKENETRFPKWHGHLKLRVPGQFPRSPMYT